MCCWTAPTFFDALGDEFLSGTDGETVTLDELKDKAKYIGLYFSAHWCPPCRGFTPSLVTSYKEHLKDKGLEIIFVSSDRCDAATTEAAKAVLEPIAEAAKAAKEEMHFFYAPSAEGPVEQVRKLTKLGEAPSAPQVVLLDIPDEGGYYTLDASEVTSEGITKLLTDYKAGRLERKQLE